MVGSTESSQVNVATQKYVIIFHFPCVLVSVNHTQPANARDHTENLQRHDNNI